MKTIGQAPIISVFNNDYDHPECPEIDVIWSCFQKRVCGLARRLITVYRLRFSDAEDISQWTFHSFVRSAKMGNYGTRLETTSVWYLLAKVTRRIVIDQYRYENRICRSPKSEEAVEDSEFVSKQPSPESRLAENEYVESMLVTLNNSRLQEVAIAMMTGYTSSEIAAQYKCSARTVERRLAEVRSRLMDMPKQLTEL